MYLPSFVDEHGDDNVRVDFPIYFDNRLFDENDFRK